MTTDDAVEALLARVHRVAVLGVSDRFTRPSFHLAAYLLDRTAWTVDLVNPHVVETLGRLCVPTLAHLPAPPDLVVIFRAPPARPAALREAADAGAPAVWLTTGTDPADNLVLPGTPPAPELDEILALGAQLGVHVVADRDLRVDHARWCAG